MRVSGQLSNSVGLLKQMPSVPRSETSISPSKAEVLAATDNKGAPPPASNPAKDTAVSSPLVTDRFDAAPNLLLQSMHALVKAESQKAQAIPTPNRSDLSETFSAGPQTLEMQTLPENELTPPTRTDLSSLAPRPNPPGNVEPCAGLSVFAVGRASAVAA